MKLENNSNLSTLNKISKWVCLLVLIPTLVAKYLHDKPLDWLWEDSYISYQKENNFTMPDVLKWYLSLDPYNTEVKSFWDETTFAIDHTSKRLFAITCPVSTLWYCLLRENPQTIKLGHLVFGSWVPIPKELISLPFDRIERENPRIVGNKA